MLLTPVLGAVRIGGDRLLPWVPWPAIVAWNESAISKARLTAHIRLTCGLQMNSPTPIDSHTNYIQIYHVLLCHDEFSCCSRSLQ